jgi:hypothetical protein
VKTRRRRLRGIEIDNLTGLRSGNHIGEVSILVFGDSGSLPLCDPLDAALFLVLLLLATKLFSATFFQLFARLTAPTLPTRSAPVELQCFCLR